MSVVRVFEAVASGRMSEREGADELMRLTRHERGLRVLSNLLAIALSGLAWAALVLVAAEWVGP